MRSNEYNNRENAESVFANKIVTRLHDGLHEMPHDFSERLRIARNLALTHYTVPKATSRIVPLSNGSTLIFGRTRFARFFNSLMSMVPLFVLICGLFAIQNYHDQNRATELADLDTELLTDDLPPSAFTDPGFAQFLRAKALSE